MEWMSDRLKQVRRKPIELSRALNIAPSRVYEMLGGKRRLQKDEIEPAAKFLEMDEEALVQAMEGGPEAARKIIAGLPPFKISPAAVEELPADLPVWKSMPLDSPSVTGAFYVLRATVIDHIRRFHALAGRSDVFSIHVQSDDMSPWRRKGQVAILDDNRPPREGDHVAVWLKAPKKKGHTDGEDGMILVVRQLVKETDKKVTVRRYHPKVVEEDILLEKIVRIFLVVDWDHLIVR
jgi:hypothetical protein